MKILIAGAGGYGRLVRDISEDLGYNVDFIDDNSPLAVGKVDEIEMMEDSYDGSIVAIGDLKIKETVFRRLKKPITIIHPTAVVSKTAKIGRGCVIEANAVINSEAEVKEGSFICAGAIINHNATVNEFCQIDCNAVVAVGAEVPRGTKVQSCTVFN